MRKADVIRITAASAIVIVVIVVLLVNFYNSNKRYQEYLQKGIYEVEDTFHYYGPATKDYHYDQLETVFMICEPPSDQESLKQLVRDYIQENDVIQTMKSREGEGFRCELLVLRFVKPSKDFPIGWNSGERAHYFSTRITDHTIVIVRIPWDADINTDYTYSFPEE